MHSTTLQLSPLSSPLFSEENMGRAPCCDKDNVKRGPWSPEEDATLKSYIETHGTGGNWIALPKKAGLRRCGKSCRLRWLNYLRPDIKHGGFTEEEDNIICRLYCEIGSRWSVIASNLPGRTDNDVKNYWNTKLKKKLLSGKMCLRPINYNSIDLDSTDSSAATTLLSSTQDLPKFHKEHHEVSASSCCIPASYLKWPSFLGVNNDHQILVQDPVYHQSEVSRGEKSNYEYGNLCSIIPSPSSSSIISNNSPSPCLCVDNNSAVSLMSYGNNNNNNDGVVGTVDLGFGFEFPVEDVVANNGAFLLETSLSVSAYYGNYSQSCNYPSFADLVCADIKPQEIKSECHETI